MGPAEKFCVVASLFLLISITATKTASRFGIPSLLAFLAIGILGGSQGPGGIQFHDIALTQTLGIVALCLILFSGGMSTDLKEIRPVFWSGIILSTLGVLIATALVAVFATNVLHFSETGGFLLGATVAATDVAAVFSVLRSRNLSLKDDLKPLLEFESAINDPMAVFLTVGLLAVHPFHGGSSVVRLLPLFFKQMLIGGALGWFGGKLATLYINRVKLEVEGLYPALSISVVLLVYGVTQWAGGSGFLAVYVTAVMLGSTNLLHKKSLILFHDGLAWLMQIAMFVAMGLLVNPTELAGVTFSGILVSAFVILIARPVSVLACLVPFGHSVPEILMASWAGLRGAVPIILATFPLIAGIPEAKAIFNIVFFVVASSVLLQGASLPLIARWLKVNVPAKPKFRYPIEYNPTTSLKNELVEIPVPSGSPLIGKSLLELGLPAEALVVLIHRKDDVLVPRGSTKLEPEDMLLVLAEKKAVEEIRGRVKPA